jgi:hypothetical protein
MAMLNRMPGVARTTSGATRAYRRFLDGRPGGPAYRARLGAQVAPCPQSSTECAEVRIRLAQAFGPTGAAEQAPDAFGRGRHDEPRRHGPTPGPAKTDAFVLLSPQAAKGQTHEGPARAGPPQEGRSLLSYCRARSTRGTKAAGAKDLAQPTPAGAAQAPRNHPPHPAPGPDRQRKPAAPGAASPAPNRHHSSRGGSPAPRFRRRRSRSRWPPARRCRSGMR